MVTFKDLEAANATIKTMTISRFDRKKGVTVNKEYAEVNQRIKAFRMLYPEGAIQTDIVSHEDGVIVMRAVVGTYQEDGTFHILGEGTAFESQHTGQINGTSYIENCETSAVGRALGMCGIGIDMSVASYEEVSNAMYQQNNLEPQKPLTYVCSRCGHTIEDANGHTGAEIAKAAKKRFGKPMCAECAKKTIEEQKAEEELPAELPDITEGA